MCFFFIGFFLSLVKFGGKTLVARAIRNAIDSRESFAIETPIFIARQADSRESLEFPIRANHPIRANRANRFARITPLRVRLFGQPGKHQKIRGEFRHKFRQNFRKLRFKFRVFFRKLRSAEGRC